MIDYDTVILGGGAAGFFCASHAVGKVAIFEKSLKVLSKVRISGGGRCNVTHSCFDPKILATYYPRGSKELLSVFSRFQPLDTIAWFEKRGVTLKTEEDGRMFPITDSSETIINCLMQAINGVDLKTGIGVQSIRKENDHFILETNQGVYLAKNLVLTTGSSPQGHAFAKQFGHTITPLVPSLFTFNVPSSPLLELAGISLPKVTVSVVGTKLQETGPLLLTHWGFSGPVILRLSAWGAPLLFEKNYQVEIVIEWESDLPKRLKKVIGDASESTFKVEGKTTYKSEFVTCGGVKRTEVDFRTMESRLCKGLFFAGEILDIDGITGGFNFQNAWSTGYIAGSNTKVT